MRMMPRGAPRVADWVRSTGGLFSIGHSGAQRTLQNNGNVKSEPKYLAYEGSPVSAFYCWTLSCSLLALRWTDLPLCFFFVRVASHPAALSTHFCTWLRQIRMLRRPSCAVVPILRHQNTSSRRRHVHMVSDILSGRDLKSTFLSVTDTYVHGRS